MTEEHNFFSPERVDEQIDHLSQSETRYRLFRQSQSDSPDLTTLRQVRETGSIYRTRQEPGHSSPDEKSLVGDLQSYYQTEQQEDLASLERAWKRVAPHLAASQERPHVMDTSPSADGLRVSQERNHRMYSQVPERANHRNPLRWPGLIAAVLVAVMLVGGLAVGLNLSHQTKISTTPPPTPTASLPIGTTVYSKMTGDEKYSSYAWSADSKRIAAFSGSGSSHIQIWDATTGAHLVNFAVQSPGEWITAMAWSPVAPELAVGTNQRILLVNTQTGAILHTLVPGQASLDISGSPYLGSQRPASGGFGYRAVSWSPDGKNLAAGISFGVSGSLQIWDVKAGVVKYTYTLGSGYVITSATWSFDGQYLAAHGFASQNIDPTIPGDIVAVWQTTTRHQVFKQKFAMSGSDAPVYWQPQKHNLALMAEVDQKLALEIWDVLANKQVLNQVSNGSPELTFSPDGKRLAWDTTIKNGKKFVGAIMITDLSSGATIYTYKEGDGALAWSPDGKYIVSSFGGQQLLDKNGPVFKDGHPELIPAYVKVWVAS